jgi:hypothetical protein
MTTPDDSIRGLEHEIERISGAISAYRSAAAAGDLIDLSGVDGQVEALCNGIASAPHMDRAKFRNPLLALIDDLNGLVEILTSGQQAVSDDLNSVSSRQRAVSAYGKGTPSGARRSGGKTGTE